MKLYAVILVATLLVLAGCATQKVLEATGGSRADGTVKLAFEYNIFESPRINWDEALNTARDRCHAWGYTDAEKFGGGVSQCQSRNAYGNCLDTIITVSYQCTGSPK